MLLILLIIMCKKVLGLIQTCLTEIKYFRSETTEKPKTGNQRLMKADRIRNKTGTSDGEHNFHR